MNCGKNLGKNTEQSSAFPKTNNFKKSFTWIYGCSPTQNMLNLRRTREMLTQSLHRMF